MPRTIYSAEFKAKLVIQVLEGAKELETIAAENNINPNMLRKWKKEFISNASAAFSSSKDQRQAEKKAAAEEEAKNKMLKTIGQLTLERDFLQDCFRKTTGKPLDLSKFGSKE